MLDRYRSWRRLLFAFLEAYSDAEARLDDWMLYLSCSLDVSAPLQLEQLLSEGKTLISQATALARKMVQEQAMAPVVDIISLDADGAGTEIGTLPLLPVVPREDCEQFFVSLRKLAQWYLDIAAFIGNLKRSRNSDQNEGA